MRLSLPLLLLLVMHATAGPAEYELYNRTNYLADNDEYLRIRPSMGTQRLGSLRRGIGHTILHVSQWPLLPVFIDKGEQLIAQSLRGSVITLSQNGSRQFVFIDL
ncbi:hypothetical protein EDC01DRAFT_636764 [Geopyxis carbonaria]|nr:hypothetical protein EDC01DRAFT_636764 [Geopyxis carbonaria]